MRHVVVTGGSTGIGKAIADAFIKAGNEVVITGRRPQQLAAAVAELGSAALRDRLTPGGAVINLSSIGAHRGRAGSYAAAKAGIEAWTTHTLAAELGAGGITANVVAPGYIGSTEFFRGSLTEERRQRLISETATKRAGTPEDIAETVLFLASQARATSLARPFTSTAVRSAADHTQAERSGHQMLPR